MPTGTNGTDGPFHKKQTAVKVNTLSRKRVIGAIAVLVLLTFSKYFYLVSITSCYIFYLMQHFHLPQRQAQLYLFFLPGSPCRRHGCPGFVGFGRQKLAAKR